MSRRPVVTSTRTAYYVARIDGGDHVMARLSQTLGFRVEGRAALQEIRQREPSAKLIREVIVCTVEPEDEEGEE